MAQGEINRWEGSFNEKLIIRINQYPMSDASKIKNEILLVLFLNFVDESIKSFPWK